MQVRSLGWEDPLEKEIATRSSILAWKVPQTEQPGELQSMGHKKLGVTEHGRSYIFICLQVRNMLSLEIIFLS